ncbi:G-protein coupled receptor 98 [Mytilus galloprovincialis]|uniref:G-protein coupled receptor 98 n=1 Tax=Mytilus galloprovincialis TaxID=29158 RepID=A0A8B6EJD1_MYTGA|nr:G-protein coupled receptor 98 [Mytilus galloprovincialis]
MNFIGLLAGVGKLEFNDGQMYHFININIMDNADPEDDKTFYVQLLNPTGGATLDVASTVTVVIRASDGAFGKFQFSDSSLNVETNELGESGYTSVFLRVDRLQGIIGTSTVTWEILGNQDNDIVDLNGIIVFNHGDTSQNLEVKVRADTVPELDETYQVKLTTVEPGELGAGDKLVSSVTILANDDPYGEFVFPSQLRPLQVEENYKNITLSINRLKGTFGTVDIYYRTLGPAELHPQVPVTVNRAGVNDYRATEGMVRFGPTEPQKTIIVTVMDDSDPENDESFYVILINATLHTPAQTRSVSNSPRLGLLSESLAQIMITSNDIANGALELSPTSVKILESAPNVGVKLLRRGGTFGQVSVKFRVVNGTAIEHSDFETISDTAIIPDGASSIDLPIRIIDDNLPELEEIFYVELLNQITGGGVLGAEQYRVAVIHILASDDPEGAFEFEIEGLSIEEPENGQPVTTNITIIRTGGSLGVVTITWTALLNGGSAASDISPVSGSVYFVSNELRRSISIQILPDNIPEGFNIYLEAQGDSIQLVSLSRSGGLFGQLRVSFSTKQTDIITEATKDGSSVLSYYNPPLGGSRGLTGIVVDISSETNQPDACGKVCLRELACVAFEVSVSLKTCAWYSTSLSTPLSNTADYQYYIKLTSKVNNLYSRRATEGIDYAIINNGFAFIPEGTNTGNVAVTIKGDNLPEINEKFLIQLNSVVLVSGVTSTKHPPTLEQNDNAYGQFNLISDYPTAIEGGHQIAVEERHKFAVDLVVERKGGNLDDVSIDWYIDIGASTATYGVDYTGDGATLQFTSGVASKLITVTILDDTVPEHNKTVIVKLRNPQGGAELSQDAMVTIVILENDNIAGIIGFGTTALVGKEGSDITLAITRARSSFGTVLVEWRIHGLNGVDPVTGFSHINGTLVFLPGDTSKDVILSILDDNTPEVNEEYQVLLSNIRTVGIGATGAAIIDPQLKMATITINSSNYPHGLLQFSQTSLEIVKEEQDVMINLQIERKFGNIGNIRVSYEIKEGSVTPLSEDLLKATAGDDFEALQGYVDIGNGISYSTIRVRVKEDSIPELDEVFIVVLTGVTLLNNSQVSNMPPQLGTKDTTSEIVISANDGTKGIIMFGSDSHRYVLNVWIRFPQVLNVWIRFPQVCTQCLYQIPTGMYSMCGSDSHSVAVDEITKNITLTIMRDEGTFGEVTVFCYAQGITDGTTQGQDFRFDPKEVTFKKGENRKYILIEINNDDTPEPDEMFEVILANPRDGAILGTPSRANVTILANDDASGSFSFETDTAVTVEETSGDVKGVAVLKVVRGPGIYGVVNVPYQVIPEQVSNVNDLSPMQSIIVFQDKQDSAILELEAVDDSEPEQIERFTVRLLQPSNGGLLGQHTDKVVIINPNDSPNGLIQIYARGTTDPREQMVEYLLTWQHNLEQPLLTLTFFGPDRLQSIPSIQVVNWYSYTYSSMVYIVMLTNFRVGELTSAIGSDGSAGTINVDRLYHSTLFKWQGEMIPLQTIETDIASAAVSFSIGGSTYLAISNTGNVRRFQSKSRIYKVNTNGTLLVIQDLPTSGAKDVKSFTLGTDNLLVFANSKDNNGNTLVPVDIYKWDQSIGMFTFAAWQSLDNQGAEAVAVFEMEGVVYIAVANNYNSVQTTYIVDSVIYKLNADTKFSEHQRIRTEGAVDVTHLLIQSLNILVFANNRGDSVNSPQKSWVYRWDSTTQMFFKHSDLNTYRVETTSAFIGPDNTVSNSIGNSEIFSWDIHDKEFKSVWTGPPAYTMFPILIPQTTGALAVMTVGGIGSTENNTVYQFVKIKDSDFSPRTITMTFEPGQKTLHTSVAIIQDDQPEEIETFYVTLSDPTGGAEIGPHNMITVNILSNDNANGIIEFPQESLEKLVIEEDDKDNTVEVKVVRKHGFFGRVVVRWSITGDQNGLSDLTPLQGTIEFPNGYSVANIRITILNDNLAELPEISYIRLTEIIESGSTDPTSGAVIGKNNVAKLIVQANDSPYGVVLWERESVTLPEPDGTDLTQEVYITRQQGMMGQLQVSFQTGIATGYPVDRQAVSGEDYVASINTVIMQENVTRVPVQLVIKQDDIPEADESFVVNITSVAVMGMTPPPGAEPSVKVPGNIITITITENDNARGSVEFDVNTNIEGRIDTYEEYGKNSTISLKVKRTIGLLGTVTVSWEAETKEASFSDFQPPSGSVTLMDGEESGQITITILDDTIAEEMETFDIKLLTVTGGSALGPNTRVRIAILKNDSPNGLFRFVQNLVSVKESTSVDDPNGEVTLNIERIQGMEGVVNVQWRLNAEAVNDFMEPIAGTVVFAQGDVIESITLKTKMDNILEGEEKFRVSLISADNSADISHIRGDASVVLLPDLGSAGTVRILPDYNTVYIGEPGESSSTYNGQVEIVLTRGAGIYGNIAVTWVLTPRDLEAFMQVEGTVQFVDLQQTAKITLQTKDDTVAEIRRIYTLQINSATGGATISTQPGTFKSDIIYVASDYPHGLFEFTLPEITSVTENTAKVSIPILRQYGRINRVMVTYTTTPGTAEVNKDFYGTSGTLTFEHEQKQRNVEITIQQDDLPEGPEMFYLNLTSARLSIPSNNNYTIINGLQLDMAPAIGSLNVKTILIEKNDNAEGNVQFKEDKFTVLEESGVAKIPVVRKGGNYGGLTVRYTVTDINATAGVDYVIADTEVMIQDGESEATIDIVLQDDSIMEYAEQFTITINSIIGGAKLGAISTTTVTIAKSDYPNGMFGFKGPLKIVMVNPARQVQTTLTIERSGGVKGQQTVNWRLMGPNNPQRVLLETNDIFYISNNQESTSGNLVWSDGESGAKTITLNIKPYSSWEIQEIFIVEIVTITGYPKSSGDGEIGPNTGKASVTIEKNGDPSGIIQFSGVALAERTVDEPTGVNPFQLQFPIKREESTGVVGTIQVFWEITGPFDSTTDFQPRNGSVYIANLQRDASFNIQILPDTLPELTETFKVILTSVEGGAEIDTSNNEAVFHIRYNDHPHGLFGLIQSQQVINVDPSDLVRSVLLNFTRHEGTFGEVMLTFTLKYDIPQSGIVLSKTTGTVKFDEGQTSVRVTIAIEGNGFLAVGTTFTATLKAVDYLEAGVTEPPALKPLETEAKITVPSEAANSVIGFRDLLAGINEETNTATMTLYRTGTYGPVSIPWQIGYRSGQEPGDGVLGSITPQTGTVTIPHGVDTKDFSVTVTALPGRVEYFVIHLPHIPSTTVSGGTQLDPTKTTVQIEPYGVVRFADNSTNPLVSELTEKVYLKV